MDWFRAASSCLEGVGGAIFVHGPLTTLFEASGPIVTLSMLFDLLHSGMSHFRSPQAARPDFAAMSLQKKLSQP